VLVHGETGTGKGLVARVIHDSGPRAQGAFIDVNCAAIPETLLEAELFGFVAGAFTDAKRAKAGLFEAAAGGTLFLDEIDALPLPLQSKFLKAVEEKRIRRLGAVTDQAVDVKVIAATAADLRTSMAEGRFRADLYHRLAVVVLEIPPLRERGGDIVVLAQQFLQHYAESHGLSPKQLSQTAEEWLQSYAWPGNVRELSHLIERVTLLHAHALLDALDDYRRLGQIALRRSFGCWLKGEHRPAIPPARRALAIARALGDFAPQVRANLCLGQLYLALGDYQQALKCLRWNATFLEGDLLRDRLGMDGLPSVLSRVWMVWCGAELGAFPEAMRWGGV